MTITSVVPPASITIGGSKVTTRGTNFQNGATITFGGSLATCVIFVDSSKETAETPAHAAGFVNVTVTNPDGSNATMTNGYRHFRSSDANHDR